MNHSDQISGAGRNEQVDESEVEGHGIKRFAMPEPASTEGADPPEVEGHGIRKFAVEQQEPRDSNHEVETSLIRKFTVEQQDAGDVEPEVEGHRRRMY